MQRCVCWTTLCGSVGLVVVALPVGAQDASPVRRLLNCRDVADDPARLACYDERARQIDDAITRRDVIVTDRAEVAATKRSLFGFFLPHIPLLDGKTTDKPVAERLDTKIVTASRSGDRWTFVLAEGGRWEQVEAGREADEPRAGMPISIKPASFGSYFARIGSGISMRIRRVG